MNSKELLFDGYKKVYSYKDDDDKEEVVKETFNEKEILRDTSLESIEKETKPKPRYTEDTFQSDLEKQGIGRPSTFQTIIKTIKDKNRGYVDVVKKEFIPTEKGIKLSHFLDENFGDIINLNYTAEMEKDLDLIANGKLDKVEFLRDFYNKLEESISKVNEVKEVCPLCGSPMVIRKGQYSRFLGCSNYPNCKGTKKLYN
jgi:DNA topoisomerase-1